MQTIKKLGVMSVAKIEGVIGVVIGFIVGVIFAVIGAAVSGVTGNSTAFAGFGVASIIIFPIFYGIVFAIFGGMGAWVYNLVAGKIGGIQIELD